VIVGALPSAGPVRSRVDVGSARRGGAETFSSGIEKAQNARTIAFASVALGSCCAAWYCASAAHSAARMMSLIVGLAVSASFARICAQRAAYAYRAILRYHDAREGGERACMHA
jgi:hypothetical protein